MAYKIVFKFAYRGLNKYSLRDRLDDARVANTLKHAYLKW
jgi:hypothetical protein